LGRIKPEETGANMGDQGAADNGAQPPLVSVSMVTYNSAPFLRRCLDSVLTQDWPRLEVIVIDNASQDNTRDVLESYGQKIRVIFNKQNRGFCGGQNQGISRAEGEWVLVLNPDTVLTPSFVSRLISAGAQDPNSGTVCGKLLRAGPDLSIPAQPEVDSAGIYFTPTFRHFDRGTHEPDGPEYSQPAYVFGATGAAAFYRKSMIEDVSVGGEFFDEDFFFSREDADVSWRAQLFGWKCLYIPQAVGYHVRRVFPGARRTLPLEINQHSVKNRFLMRIKNATLGLTLANLPFVIARDAGILFYCLIRERGSIDGLTFVLRNWSRVWAKRRFIQERSRVPEDYIKSWFRFRPVTFPAPFLLISEEGASIQGKSAGGFANLTADSATQRPQ
jgi:GT2 family glycosyltransferase